MQLTVRDAAALLEQPEHRIYEWVDAEEIPFYRVNDQVRFNRTELLEWATSRRLAVSLQAFQAAGQEDEAMPSLASALRLGGVHAGVAGADRKAVLRAVVSRMPLPAEEDRELLLAVLLGRESLGAMTIGQGIAIPHVRNPIVLDGAAASMTLCYLERAVDFGASDGQPIHTIFSIVSATIRGHLQLLAKLSWALSSADFRAVLDRRAAPEVVIVAAEAVEASFRARSPKGRATP